MSVDTISRKIKLFYYRSVELKSRRPHEENHRRSLYIHEMRNVNIILWVDQMRSYSHRRRDLRSYCWTIKINPVDLSEARRWRKTTTNNQIFFSLFDSFTSYNRNNEDWTVWTRMKREDDVKTRSDIDDGD